MFEHLPQSVCDAGPKLWDGRGVAKGVSLSEHLRVSVSVVPAARPLSRGSWSTHISLPPVMAPKKNFFERLAASPNDPGFMPHNPQSIEHTVKPSKLSTQQPLHSPTFSGHDSASRPQNHRSCAKNGRLSFLCPPQLQLASLASHAREPDLSGSDGAMGGVASSLPSAVASVEYPLCHVSKQASGGNTSDPCDRVGDQGSTSSVILEQIVETSCSLLPPQLSPSKLQQDCKRTPSASRMLSLETEAVYQRPRGPHFEQPQPRNGSKAEEEEALGYPPSSLAAPPVLSPPPRKSPSTTPKGLRGCKSSESRTNPVTTPKRPVWRPPSVCKEGNAAGNLSLPPLHTPKQGLTQDSGSELRMQRRQGLRAFPERQKRKQACPEPPLVRSSPTRQPAGPPSACSAEAPSVPPHKRELCRKPQSSLPQESETSQSRTPILREASVDIDAECPAMIGPHRTPDLMPSAQPGRVRARKRTSPPVSAAGRRCAGLLPRPSGSPKQQPPIGDKTPRENSGDVPHNSAALSPVPSSVELSSAGTAALPEQPQTHKVTVLTIPQVPLPLLEEPGGAGDKQQTATATTVASKRLSALAKDFTSKHTAREMKSRTPSAAPRCVSPTSRDASTAPFAIGESTAASKNKKDTTVANVSCGRSGPPASLSPSATRERAPPPHRKAGTSLPLRRETLEHAMRMLNAAWASSLCDAAADGRADAAHMEVVCAFADGGGTAHRMQTVTVLPVHVVTDGRSLVVVDFNGTQRHDNYAAAMLETHALIEKAAGHSSALPASPPVPEDADVVWIPWLAMDAAEAFQEMPPPTPKPRVGGGPPKRRKCPVTAARQEALAIPLGVSAVAALPTDHLSHMETLSHVRLEYRDPLVIVMRPQTPMVASILTDLHQCYLPYFLSHAYREGVPLVGHWCDHPLWAPMPLEQASELHALYPALKRQQALKEKHHRYGQLILPTSIVQGLRTVADKQQPQPSPLVAGSPAAGGRPYCPTPLTTKPRHLSAAAFAGAGRRLGYATCTTSPATNDTRPTHHVQDMNHVETPSTASLSGGGDCNDPRTSLNYVHSLESEGPLTAVTDPTLCWVVTVLTPGGRLLLERPADLAAAAGIAHASKHTTVRDVKQGLVRSALGRSLRLRLDGIGLVFAPATPPLRDDELITGREAVLRLFRT